MPSPCGREPKTDKKDAFSEKSGYIWTGPNSADFVYLSQELSRNRGLR